MATRKKKEFDYSSVATTELIVARYKAWREKRLKNPQCNHMPAEVRFGIDTVVVSCLQQGWTLTRCKEHLCELFGISPEAAHLWLSEGRQKLGEIWKEQYSGIVASIAEQLQYAAQECSDQGNYATMVSALNSLMKLYGLGQENKKVEVDGNLNEKIEIVLQ